MNIEGVLDPMVEVPSGKHICNAFIYNVTTCIKVLASRSILESGPFRFVKYKIHHSLKRFVCGSLPYISQSLCISNSEFGLAVVGNLENHKGKTRGKHPERFSSMNPCTQVHVSELLVSFAIFYSPGRRLRIYVFYHK